MGGPVNGRETSGLDSEFNVPACVRAGDELYTWRNCSCRCKSGPDSGQPDERARCRGDELANSGVTPGQWVLVEAFSGKGDEMWLGRTVPLVEKGSSCMEKIQERCHLDGTRYDPGNFRIAVQWYERVVDDSGSRLDFRPGEPGKSYFCSTELRLVGARVERTGLATPGCSLTLPAPPSPISPSSSSSSLPASCSAAATHSEEKEAEEQDLDGDDEVSIWRLHMADEAAGLAFCR